VFLFKKVSKSHLNIKRIFTELNFYPGQTIFVKPNLCGRVPILAGENTSLKVMDALIDVLSDFGCKTYYRAAIRPALSIFTLFLPTNNHRYNCNAIPNQT
jgi:hypothetical protein